MHLADSHSWAVRITLCFAFALASATAHGEETAGHEFADFLLIPLRVHLLTAADAPNVATTLSDKDIDRILLKIIAVWAQAGIHFWLESRVREEATNSAGFAEAETLRPGSRLLALRPDASKTDRALHLYYIKSMLSNGIHFPPAMFVKDTAALREVSGGIDEPLPRVSSHEIGHALGLPHRQDTTNLMASGTTGTTLNAAEIATARAAAQKLTCMRTAAVVLQIADEAWTTDDRYRARELYRQLITLPVTFDGFDRIKQRAAGE